MAKMWPVAGNMVKPQIWPVVATGLGQLSQARLNSLAIISIENERAKNVNFDDVIDKFADAKARRMRI